MVRSEYIHCTILRCRRNVWGRYFGRTEGTIAPIVQEKWLLDNCYPFARRDSHKKTSAKALIMAHAYSNVIIDKIEEAVKNGVVGNETEDW